MLWTNASLWRQISSKQSTLSFVIGLLRVFPATSVLDVITLFSPKFSCPYKQIILQLGLMPKEASHFWGKGSSLLSSLSMALNHSPVASAEEIPIIAALVC